MTIEIILIVWVDGVWLEDVEKTMHINVAQHLGFPVLKILEAFQYGASQT